MRDRFDRDTDYGRNERRWEQRYGDDRSYSTERGWARDERRRALPIYERRRALPIWDAARDHRDWGREHGRTYRPATQRDDLGRSLDDGRFAGEGRGLDDQDRGIPHDDRGGDYVGGRDASWSFGGNPLPPAASAYSFNLGGAYHLGMTRVVSPDAHVDEAWRDGPYHGESHDLARTARESGHSALEGVSHALHKVGDRVRSAFGRGPKGYKRSDARIQEDICEMLSDRGDIDVSDVTVRVENNEVTLEGTVPERHHKRIIEHVAEGVRGVEDVHNRIRVQRAIEPTTRSTAGTMGDAALAGTQQGASRPAESHAARLWV
ncbi:hypothetical protein BE20_25685 [Sorangium cellulosum]|nr:hypothetical protein BE20_25685 [Sorangium cellulosum]